MTAFLDVKFHKIQKLAKNIGADIAVEDESGVEVMTRSGRTWGAVGESPKVVATACRGRDNVRSIITAEGQWNDSLEEQNIDGKRYIEFLQQILRGRTRPLIVIADNAPFHRSAKVRQFVRAHRTQIRMFFFPPPAPELNPDEPVWNDIKHRQLGKQPIKNKLDLKKRLCSALKSLPQKAEMIRSFFSFLTPDMPQYRSQLYKIKSGY